MRTENNPTNIIQSSTLSAKVQDLNLANQLFSVGGGDQSFNQILSSHVQSQRDQGVSRADSASSPRCHGAKQRPESGNGLPEDKRLEQQQRAEHDERNVRVEDRRAEDRRAEQHRESKTDRTLAAGEKVRGDQAREDQLSEEELQAAAELEEAQAKGGEGSELADPAAPELTDPSLEVVESGSEEAADSTLNEGDEQITELVLDDSSGSNAEAEDVLQADGNEPEPGQAEEILASQDESNEVISDDLAATDIPEADEAAQSLEAKEDTTEVSDPEVQVALNTESKGVQNDSGKAGTTVDDLKSARDGTPSMASTLHAGKEQQNASNKAAADGQSVTSQAANESQEMPVFEPKADKKSELGLLADKFAQKPAAGESVVPTPVQERLAALAKALDKVGSSNRSQSVTKAAEQVDTVKATPFQRSLEQVGRAMAGTKPPMATMQAPMQSREWGSEMAQRLVMMVSTKLNSAKIQLNPQEMGSIDVRVSVKHDQAHVVFTSQVAPTRDALEQAIPRLREMMEQNGVALGDVDVRDQDARESHEQGNQNQRQNARVADGGSTVEEASIANADNHVAVGIVDYYA